MTRIPDAVIDSVRESVDLADLIGRYAPLKRAGSGSYKACCLFHQEKTPSFHIWTATGTWKCFGCGKGGNAFTFLMEKEGLTFPEAVRQLAKDLGIRIDEDDDPAAAEMASRIKRLREVMEWANVLFQKGLRVPEGRPAREYLKRRGVTGETARTFRLGFALPGWQNLVDAAHRDGIPEADLVDLGLVRRKEADAGAAGGRLYDFFRDRVTFPICDTQGHVIAFGARTLGDDEPKYLNSPETPLFSKGRTVYALDLAKREMLRTGEGAVMEGYTDVIMAHQCGWPVAVAGLGTALTRDQASLIARYVKKVHLVYDGDAAGQKAAEKNAPAFLPEEIETRVTVLPAGEDPCDTLIRGGLPALLTCIAASREAFDHLLDVKRAAHDMKSVPGQAMALDAALEALVPLTNDVRRALYVTRLSETYRIQEEVVLNRLRDLRAKAGAAERRGSHAAPRPEPPPREVAAAQPSAVAEASPDEPARPAAKPSPRPSGPPSATEEHLVEALLGRPELCAEAAERLPVQAVVHPLCREIVDRLLARYEETGATPPVGAMLGAIADPQLASFAAGLLSRGEGKDLERQGRDCIANLALQHEWQEMHAGGELFAEPDGQHRELSSEEGDFLRRQVEFHRRRSAGA